jgi:hypothetical protein
MLFADVSQNHHIITLTLVDRTTVPRAVSTRCDVQNMTKPIHGDMVLVFFDKRKSHLPWPAKNTVAFFNISLASVRRRTSLRSRSFSLARSISEAGGRSSGRDCCIHFDSVEKPTPKSDATCLRVSPLVSAMRTASRRNSSVWRCAIFILLDGHNPIQGHGTNPGQVQMR